MLFLLCYIVIFGEFGEPLFHAVMPPVGAYAGGYVSQKSLNDFHDLAGSAGCSRRALSA